MEILFGVIDTVGQKRPSLFQVQLQFRRAFSFNHHATIIENLGGTDAPLRYA